MELLTQPDGRLRPGVRALLGILTFIVVSIVVMLLAGVIVRITGWDGDVVARPLLLLFLLLAFSGLLKIADRVKSSTVAAQGLSTRVRWGRQLAIGTAMGFLMVVLGVAAIGQWGTLLLEVDLGGKLVPFLLMLWMISTAALAEEVAFRGYPFQRLVESIGAWPAIAVLSTLFAAVHLANPNSTLLASLNTALFGIVLSVAYLRTRSLWLPWGLHFGWNFALGVVFGLPVSGITEFGVLSKATYSGPVWLTGGGYGLEGSVTCVVLIVLATGATWAVTRGEPLPPEPQPEQPVPEIVSESTASGIQP